MQWDDDMDDGASDGVDGGADTSVYAGLDDGVYNKYCDANDDAAVALHGMQWDDGSDDGADDGADDGVDDGADGGAFVLHDNAVGAFGNASDGVAGTTESGRTSSIIGSAFALTAAAASDARHPSTANVPLLFMAVYRARFNRRGRAHCGTGSLNM